jgi:uncharacterized damage-inducible protein DinB
MNVADVHELFEYDRWANERLLSAVTPETFDSVRETLAHILLAEWLWLQRVKGTSPRSVPESMNDASFDALRARFDPIGSEWREHVASLTDADLERRVDYVRLEGEAGSRKLAHLLQHVVNHSTYHRGQVSMRLRQAGGVPVETDFLHFTA